MKQSSMVVAAVLASVVAMLSACTSTVPDCGGEDVKAVVYDIVRRELATGIFIGKTGAYLPEGVTLKRIIAESTNEAHVQQATEALRQAQETAMNLHGIRTDSRDKEARATACAATLDIGDRTLEITYGAQYSEDGMVYVELAGL